MEWVKERDLLIAQTMAFVQSVNDRKLGARRLDASRWAESRIEAAPIDAIKPIEATKRIDAIKPIEAIKIVEQPPANIPFNVPAPRPNRLTRSKRSKRSKSSSSRRPTSRSTSPPRDQASPARCEPRCRTGSQVFARTNSGSIGSVTNIAAPPWPGCASLSAMIPHPLRCVNSQGS